MKLLLVVSLVLAKDIRSQFITNLNSSKLDYFANLHREPLSIESTLLKPLLVPRVSGTESNLRVQQFIKQTLSDLNYHIEEDTFTASTPRGPTKFNNIIATKDPSASERLILAAHFDSKYFGDKEFVGATDSSVPCAILLDVAKTLNPMFEDMLNYKRNSSGLYNGYLDLNRQPTLQLVFFDGEEAFVEWSREDSLYGSRHLAEKWANMMITPQNSGFESVEPRNMLTGIKALILLDLLGAPSPRIPNSHSETRWAWSRLMNIEERLYHAELLSKPQISAWDADPDLNAYFFDDDRKYYVDDDHRPFMERGVPIVHVIPVPFPKVWHTLDDNQDALSQDTIEDLALMFRVFVAEYFGLV